MQKWFGSDLEVIQKWLNQVEQILTWLSLLKYRKIKFSETYSPIFIYTYAYAC